MRNTWAICKETPRFLRADSIRASPVLRLICTSVCACVDIRIRGVWNGDLMGKESAVFQYGKKGGKRCRS